jgi:hypothetical protein
MNTQGLGQLAYEKGMYILTASQDIEQAYVSSVLKHSYLTYALLQGMKNSSADNKPADGELLLREWFDFATQEVPLLRRANEERKSVEQVGDEDQGRVQTPRVFYPLEVNRHLLVIAKTK